MQASLGPSIPKGEGFCVRGRRIRAPEPERRPALIEDELTEARLEVEAWKAEAERWRSLAMTQGREHSTEEEAVRPDKRAQARIILDQVARFYGITVEEIRGLRRTPAVAEARSVAMKLLRDLINLSTVDAGRIVNRTHSNVVKMTLRLEARARTSLDLSAWVEHIHRAAEASLTKSERARRRQLQPLTP